MLTNIGINQAYILGPDGLRQLNLAHEAFICYILQESMGTYNLSQQIDVPISDCPLNSIAISVAEKEKSPAVWSQWRRVALPAAEPY